MYIAHLIVVTYRERRVLDGDGSYPEQRASRRALLDVGFTPNLDESKLKPSFIRSRSTKVISTR